MLFQTVIVVCLAVFSIAQTTNVTAVQPSNSTAIQATNGTTIQTTTNVTLSYGQYQGKDTAGITQFLGVRYANNPQRFSASGPPLHFAGIRNATTYGSPCQGSGTLAAGHSEDCLFADIYTPTNAIQRNSTLKLPVFVFIQGGGLTNSLGRFDTTGLIQAANNSIMTVTFTYRTGPFGFLASQEVQANGTLNAGLLDQLQLLRWVQREIPHFGGDPHRVTVGGQSAGAGSLLAHITANSANNSGLFQGVIMQSPSSPPVRRPIEQQFQYDALVHATNCTGPDTLACLRRLSTQQVLSGSAIVPYPGNHGTPVYGWHIVVDGTYIQDIPFDAIANGKVAKVPIMTGSVSNEGTIFVPTTTSNETQAQDFMKNNYPNATDSDLGNYTTPYAFDSSSPSYWLKLAEAYGETRYTCPTVYVSDHVASWNYRYGIATAAQIASLEGAYHGSDLAALWAPRYGNSDQRNLLQGAAKQASQWYQGYWTSFIRTHNPNTYRFAGSPVWGNSSSGNRFLFNVTGSTMELMDPAQRTRCNFLGEIGPGMEQ